MILCSTWLQIKKDTVTIVIIEQLCNSWKLAMKKHELMVEHGQHIPKNAHGTTIYSSTTKIGSKLVMGRTDPLRLEKRHDYFCLVC